MPLTYHIDTGLQLVRSRATGILSETDSAAHYARMGVDPDFQPDFRQLCDLREVSEIQSSSEFLQNLARSSIFNRGTRRAFVAPNDLYFGLARMLQTFSELDGREVGVFRTIGEAEEWLGPPPEDS